MPLAGILDGLMPDELRLRRSRSNFDAVFHASLAGPDLPHLRNLLADPGAEVGAYVDLERVRRELLEPEPPSHPIPRRNGRCSAGGWPRPRCGCAPKTTPAPSDAAHAATAADAGPPALALLEEAWDSTYSPPLVRDYGMLEPAGWHPVRLP